MNDNLKYKSPEQESLDKATADYINALTGLKNALDSAIKRSEERNEVYKSFIKILTDFIK